MKTYEVQIKNKVAYVKEKVHSAFYVINATSYATATQRAIKRFKDEHKVRDAAERGLQILVTRTAALALLIFALLIPSISYAAEIPQDMAVKAILGEAEDQGFNGMLAIAVGIRNRGTLKGVYGVKAKRPNTPGMIPVRYWDMARRAWAESETNRIHEADHWENIKAFGKPRWADSMQEVYRVKDHVFYSAKGGV